MSVRLVRGSAYQECCDFVTGWVGHDDIKSTASSES